MTEQKQTVEWLEENCKVWSIDTCVWHLVTQGMCFMADKITEEELKQHKKIIGNHLKSLQNLSNLEQPKADVDYVKVPKDIYDKMDAECTLAAIRRWDFTTVPIEPQAQSPVLEECPFCWGKMWLVCQWNWEWFWCWE